MTKTRLYSTGEGDQELHCESPEDALDEWLQGFVEGDEPGSVEIYASEPVDIALDGLAMYAAQCVEHVAAWLDDVYANPEQDGVSLLSTAAGHVAQKEIQDALLKAVGTVTPWHHVTVERQEYIRALSGDWLPFGSPVSLKT